MSTDRCLTCASPLEDPLAAHCAPCRARTRLAIVGLRELLADAAPRAAEEDPSSLTTPTIHRPPGDTEPPSARAAGQGPEQRPEPVGDAMGTGRPEGQCHDGGP